VVNPPAAKKYAHWVNDRIAATPDAWLEGATEKPGSWWPDWHKWNAKHAGKKVPARTPGDGKLDVIEDTPGSYARLKAQEGARLGPNFETLRAHSVPECRLGG
jgi:polyhydroxyalkanoate synthase